MQSILAKLFNYKDLTNINGGSVYLTRFLARFSLFFPLRPQPCFKPLAVLKMEANRRPAVAAIAAVSHLNRLQTGG